MFDSEFHGNFSSAKVLLLSASTDATIARELVQLLLAVHSLEQTEIVQVPIIEVAAVIRHLANCPAQAAVMLVVLSATGLANEAAVLKAVDWERLTPLVRTEPLAVLLDDIPPERLPAALKKLAPIHLHDGFEVEQMLGTIAGALGTEHVLNLVAIRSQLTQLTQYRTESARADARRSRRVRLRIGLFAALAVSFGTYAFHKWTERTNEVAARATKFDFEHVSEGWEPSTSQDTRACTAVALSDSESHYGHHSLQVAVDLDVADASKRQGEIYIDFTKQRSAQAARSIDLRNKVITAWVKAPGKAVGDDTKPNGVQLFVRDTEGRSQYGSWLNLQPHQWQQLHIAVGRAEGGEFVSVGFNPNNVTVIGLKFAAGTGAKGSYSGFLYFDSVDWIGN
jgi:hypothetical protein